VRGVSKTLVIALAALLLAGGLVACGGDDGADSTAAEAGGQGQAAGESNGNAQQGDAGDKGKSGSAGGKQGSGEGEAGSGSDASDFTPKRHNDSGGGSQQFRTKGGDNSVQEFGEEADEPDFEAAAVALHNFLDARAEGNWAAACEYMSNGIVQSFEKLAAQAEQIDDTSCAGILEQLTNPAAKQSMKAEAAQANVGSLRVEGDRSFVIYTGIDGTLLAMPMANEDGDWKVSSLAGTPLS
jgi:hypothetical protein